MPVATGFFLFLLRIFTNYFVVSHQYQSLRVFNVKVITVDLITVLIH